MNATNPAAPDDSNLRQTIPAHTAPGREREQNTGMAPGSSFSHLAHWIHQDVNGMHLINFPFSFVVFLILTTGLIIAGSGIILANPWLAGLGLLTILVWCFLRGWCVGDE
ncbi:MAG TPA: hypothetical protein VN673_12670 [Clostridia bacterium]|nr:hypothetical protein [Clostridia bacterium]